MPKYGDLVFVAPDEQHQATLDRANEAYYKVCLENNNWEFIDASEIYEALMLAWEYIMDTTTNRIYNA